MGALTFFWVEAVHSATFFLGQELSVKPFSLLSTNRAYCARWS